MPQIFAAVSGSRQSRAARVMAVSQPHVIGDGVFTVARGIFADCGQRAAVRTWHYWMRRSVFCARVISRLTGIRCIGEPNPQFVISTPHDATLARPIEPKNVQSEEIGDQITLYVTDVSTPIR